MAKGVTYADAVKLLGDGDSRIVAALDRLAGGILLAAAASGVGFVLSLFDPKAELARLSRELVNGMRLGGRKRADRSERLAAAHAVLVMAAYFETLNEVQLPFDIRELELTAADQRELASSALNASIVPPAPHRPYEMTLTVVNELYQYMSAAVSMFVEGLSVWDSLDATRRDRFMKTVNTELPGRAVTRYEELFRRLATEFPEVAFWSNQVDHQATRAEIRSLGVGLAGVERVLAGIATGQYPDERRLLVARAHRSALGHSILQWPHTPAGVTLPALGDAYVNPDFRVPQSAAMAELSDESTWKDEPVRSDFQEFLLGHLTSPQAFEAPLLILGQPGSGKSVLTQVIAARLPPSEFLVVRVVLRQVPADADLQDQIELAVRWSTGENLTWPELVRGAGDALPVVMLDGFDELLQTTGVSQSDYLERVANFQRREADLGRPVVVLVTSRTAVADRARPVPGLVAVRLEPFSESQVGQWLDVWNAANLEALQARGWSPLPASVALEYPDLAAQPLLLLLLALYDADGNPLQRNDVALGQAELYERLLTRFVERELRKTDPGLSAPQQARAVDQELLRLSVVALAMFNRRRQWVSESDLDADLAVLFGPPPNRADPGHRAALTAAELAIGKFFFIHQAQAIRDDQRLRTYEFLHATFGEYLIGRLISKELDDLVAAAGLNTSRTRSAPVDDAFLHALLSFAPLTMRDTTVLFLAERLLALPDERRDALRDLLLPLFHRSQEARHPSDFDAYQPYAVSVPGRHAAYSVNLMLILVLTAGRVTVGELFPDQPDPVLEWRSAALLWRSQLPVEGWYRLVHLVTVSRGWGDNGRTVSLSLRDRSDPVFDPYWSYGIPADNAYRESATFGFVQNEDVSLRLQSSFLCDTDDDTLAHALEPFARHLPRAVSTFFDFRQGRTVSAAHALINLWLASGTRDHEPIVEAHTICLEFAINGFAPYDVGPRRVFRQQYFHQLAADRAWLPADWLRDAVDRLKRATEADSKEAGDLLQIATRYRLI